MKKMNFEFIRNGTNKYINLFKNVYENCFRLNFKTILIFLATKRTKNSAGALNWGRSTAIRVLVIIFPRCLFQ